jgi:hypothetical protein
VSSLWTPGGERPVAPERPSSPASPPSAPGDDDDFDDRNPPTEEELAELAALQRQLLEVPAAVVIANHAIGLFQLAALHLNQEQPNLEQAQLAIDALRGIVDGLGARLGEHEPPLREALAQLQMAYVQVKGNG